MSDLDKKYPLRLDTRINFKNLIPHFYISDNQTNDFYIKLTNDNKPVEVEDIIVVIAVINPNGNINSSFLDTKTEKGLIYCNLPNELKNVVGVYKARIMCISGEERIVSNTFEYKVDTDEFQIIDEITEDSEEMIVLSQMLSRLSNMEIESQANETERTANETERIANEAERIENENLRQQAENNRNTTEEARVVAESNRISNESERVLGEQTRVENEQNRISAENKRISDENIRKENENRRLEKENNNVQAELNRVQAESNRVQAELKREQSESNRKNSENARNDNEDIRKQNELKRQSNENTRITNESTRIANENERAKVNANRQQAEQTRVTNERNRKEAETARANAERNRASNESVRISNENIRKNNEEKRKEEFKAKIIEIDNALANLETPDSIAWENVVGKPTFATVATSGSYNDLTDKPTIPTVGIPSLVGSNENKVKIWELEDGVYNLSGILKYRYDYYSTETGRTLEGWQIEGLYIIYNAGDDPDNEGRTIKICKNLKYNFYFKYSLLNGTIESSRYDPEYIKEDNSNPIGEEEAITVLPNNLTGADYYNLPAGVYRVTASLSFEADTNCDLRNGITSGLLALPDGSIINSNGSGQIINLTYSFYLILNDTGKVCGAGSSNNAWTGELATVAISGSYNDLTDKPTIPAAYTHPATHPASMITGLSTVATSGSYADLTNKPTIPTVTNDLTNALKSNYDTAYAHSQAAHAPTNAEANVQADWNVTDTGSDAYIKNKPTIPAAYTHPTTHPASMITGLANVATTGSYNDLSNKPTIPAAYTHPTSHPASMITGLATVATSGSYNDLSNKPTIPTIPSSLPANGGNADTVNNFHLWKGTQAEYDAITTKDSNTIYMITG